MAHATSQRVPIACVEPYFSGSASLRFGAMNLVIDACRELAKNVAMDVPVESLETLSAVFLCRRGATARSE
jgi:hypothetical protein